MQSFKEFVKGIRLRPVDGGADPQTEPTDNIEGTLWYYQSKLKAYMDSAVREVITADQTQTLTNKTFGAGNTTTFQDTTDSTDKDTGAVIIEGGLGVEKSVNIGLNLTVEGDLTVEGATTTVNTATLDVEDANITVNKGGNQAAANTAKSGLTVEMSDATDAVFGYDSTTTSKFVAGEATSEAEVATVSHTQTLTNKTIDADNNTISNLEVDNLKAGVLDTDLSSVSASDDTLASAKAIKTYVDAEVAAKDDASEITYTPNDLTDWAGSVDPGNVDGGLDQLAQRVTDDEAALSSHTGSSSAHGTTSAIVGISDTQTLTNKTITIDDTNLTIQDDGDNTKKLKFDASTISAATTRTITAPDADGTLILDGATQTVINKTIDADNNTISNLEVDNLKSGVLDTDLTSVSASDDTIPSAKATKAYVDSVAGDTDFADDTFRVSDNTDNTKKIAFEASGITTGTTRTLTAPNESTTITGTDATQTLTNKTIDGDNNTISNLAHGAEVDNPSSGVHGVTGSVVGTTDAQVLTAKDYDGGTASNTSRMTVPKAAKATLDALTRKEATIVYATDEDRLYVDDGTTLNPVGSGEGGGLDTYHTETFELTTASDFTSGNNATFDNGGTLQGTLADETTSPIAGDSSLKFTQAAGSLNDWVKSPAITLDDKQKGNYTGITLYYTYDGNADDISFVFYDDTNNTVLTGSTDTFKNDTNPTRYTTSTFIPTTCSTVAYGFQVEVANSGAILTIDDVELSTDPFVYKELASENTYTSRIANNGTATITSDGASGITSVSRTGVGIVLVTLDSTVFSEMPAVTATVSNSANIFASVQNISFPTFEVYARSDAGTLTDKDFHIALHKQGADYSLASEHIVTPSSSPQQYSQAAGDFTVTSSGTGWSTGSSEIIYYKSADNKLYAKGTITGTLSAGTTSHTLTISGLTFKTGGTNSLPALVYTTGGDITSGRANGGASTLLIESNNSRTSWGVTFDLELDSPPTWADPVSSQYLAAAPLNQIFRANLSANQSVSAGVSAWTTVELDTEVGGANKWQNFGTLDTTTNVGRFTVNRGAWYRITFSLAVFNFSDSANECGVWLNGAQWNEGLMIARRTGGNEFFIGKSVVTYLSTNDYLELRNRAGGADGVYDINGAGTYMSIELLRE